MTSTISALTNAVCIVPSPNQQTQISNLNNSNIQNTTNLNTVTSSSTTTTTILTSSTTTTNPNPITTNNSNSNFIAPNLYEEKVYKKEKQILFEFDTKTKDLKSQLNEGIKCLEQRLDTQISILYELQDFFKKRAEVELQYSRDLDKLTKQIYARHKSEKSKRENWHLHSTFKLWESLLADTKQHSKYHQVASEIASQHVASKFDEIIEDIKRIFQKCKSVGQASHEEIFKVVGELNGAMKTYHEYQSESKQAEAKLKYVQSQKPKYEKQKSKKKLKQYEKQVEKRLQKYTETKVKAFKARNEYILSIDSANACIKKFCTEDVGDLVDCTDFGFHSSVAKCIYMYLSAQENIKRSRQLTVDSLSRSIGDLDSNADKVNYLESFAHVFNIQKKFQFEPHKGDEVSQVNAQSLIRYEMEKRFEQLDNRLKTLKTENDEIFKTIEATEKSLLNYFDVKNCDMSDLFRDLNLPNQNTAINKQKRIEVEDYYVEKVRQYTTSSNLIARLEARHSMMQKALMGCVNSCDNDKLSGLGIDMNTQKIKKKIGKSPIIGQPRLFGGKLIEYINATKQEIPQIITSCIKAINRLGLHNQGIFRIPGSQLEINQFKESFEKGEDPLITVNPREMNSVAGVLKLYLRELKDPLFPRDTYDAFLNAVRSTTITSTSGSTTTNNSMSASVMSSPSLLQSANNENSSNTVFFNGSESINQLSSLVDNTEMIKVENIRKVMVTVSKPIYIVIRYLFGFLNHLSEFKDENMMDAYNIAICLAPTLIPVPEDKKDQVNHQTDTIELIKLIIQHNEEIFNMECDGPVYEKFDTDALDEEENVEESGDEDDEEESKEFMRNISDDETYATEAIALFDYKGRSDKELSFKKGSLLAIKGQLSADWWQGSLITSQSNTTPKLGYIPDKYIALRSNKRKTSNSLSLNLTPSSVSSTTQSSNTINTISAQTQLKSNDLEPSNRVNSANELDLNRSNLSELSQVKESDILNDDDAESLNLNLNEHFSAFLNLKNAQAQLNNQNNALRSSSNSISLPSHLKQHNQQQALNVLCRKRNSTSSSNSVQLEKSLNYLPLQKNTTTNNKQQSSANTMNNTSLDDLLLNSKQKLKMNHIEDALASVLDDMKQLDFSTSLATTPIGSNNNNNNQNPLIATIKNNSMFKTLPDNSTTNGFGIANSNNNNNNGLRTSSLRKTAIKSKNNLSLKANHRVYFNDEDLTSSGDESSDDLNRKSNGNANTDLIKIANQFNSSINDQILNSNLNKRPDLVLDLPINLLLSTSPSQQQQQLLNAASLQTAQSSTPRQPASLAQSEAKRLSIDLAAGSPQISKINALNKAKEQLHSSSTSSTESATSSSSNSIGLLKTNTLKSVQTPETAHKILNGESGECKMEQAGLPLRNFNVDFMCDSLTTTTTTDTITTSSYSTTTKSVNGTPQTPQTQKSKIVTLPCPHLPVVSSTATSLVIENRNEADLEKENCSTLERTRIITRPPRAASSSAEPTNLIELAINNENKMGEDVSTPQTNKQNQMLNSASGKKQPPPLMKKPEKSDEILRKLGKSPPNELKINTISASSSTSSSNASTISSSVSLSSSSSQIASNNSPTLNSGNKSNLSIRLSNSKATDV